MLEPPGKQLRRQFAGGSPIHMGVSGGVSAVSHQGIRLLEHAVCHVGVRVQAGDNGDIGSDKLPNARQQFTGKASTRLKAA